MVALNPRLYITKREVTVYPYTYDEREKAWHWVQQMLPESTNELSAYTPARATLAKNVAFCLAITPDLMYYPGGLGGNCVMVCLSPKDNTFALMFESDFKKDCKKTIFRMQT